MTFEEMFKTTLVFVHFFASAVALATILRTDFLILTHFTHALSAKVCGRIHAAKSTVSLALVVLWVSGLSICVLGYLHDPAYVENQKLWMKVLVVVVLTLNGWFLHRFAFRAIRPGMRLVDVAPRNRLLLTWLACLSSASWVFASFLGIARALNNRHNFAHVLELYLFVLALNLLSGWALLSLLTRVERAGFINAIWRKSRWSAVLKRHVSDWQESELQA